MLGALIEGERDPAVLADLVRGRLRSKIGQLTDALQGRFSDRHAFMAREYLERIDRLEESIQRLDKRIKAAMVDHEPGVCPGHNESAGNVKSSQVRPGNSYLKAGLGIAAMAAAKSNGTYLQARHKRLAARRGAMRALVATEHSMIVSIWNILSTGEIYNELGAEFSSRHNPGLARRRAIAQLNRLGYKVSLTTT